MVSLVEDMKFFFFCFLFNILDLKYNGNSNNLFLELVLNNKLKKIFIWIVYSYIVYGESFRGIYNWFCGIFLFVWWRSVLVVIN